MSRFLTSSKPYYPSEETGSRILRGYCGAGRFIIRPKQRDPCRRCLVPRTKGQWPGCQGERLRITLSSAPRGFNKKTIVLVKAIPKQLFEGDVNGIKPTWKYGA